MKFLDLNGLNHLWTKIKNTFVKKSDIGVSVCPLSSNVVPANNIGNYNVFHVPLKGTSIKLSLAYNVVVLSDCDSVHFQLEPKSDSYQIVVDVYTPMTTKNIPVTVDPSHLQWKSFDGKATLRAFLPQKAYHLVIDLTGTIYCKLY